MVTYHREAILVSMKKVKRRGIHVVEVKEEWLGKTWGEGKVDQVHAMFVERKNISKAIEGIRGDLLRRVLEEVDRYKPKKGELCFFIFVCSPRIREAIVQSI